jgi:hypothetical protein
MPVLLNVFFGLWPHSLLLEPYLTVSDAGLPQALSNIQMILICTVTDVLPALSLIYEKPEADLLLRKPRNRKTDRLANWRLLCHAYFFIGVLESLTAMTGWASAFRFPPSGVWLLITTIVLSISDFNGMGFHSRLFGSIMEDLFLLVQTDITSWHTKRSPFVSLPETLLEDYCRLTC